MHPGQQSAMLRLQQVRKQMEQAQDATTDYSQSVSEVQFFRLWKVQIDTAG